MKINQAAHHSGLDAKTIRYYESIGLVDAPQRSDNGYRHYSERQCQELLFLRRSRQAGFSIEECRSLLCARRNANRRSADVHKLVSSKLLQLEDKIAELTIMRDNLAELAAACAADDAAHCEIIARLSVEGDRS